MITLVAKDGYVYTNGQVYCKTITIPKEKIKDYYEISEEEYNMRGIKSMI